MPATAALTIVKPGTEAEAVMAEIAEFVAVERTGDTTAVLTFEHADALAAVPVLGTYLRRRGHPDWEAYVEVTTSARMLVARTARDTRRA